MTIKTSLITLNKAIENGRILKRGDKVFVPIIGKVEIYGFIVYDETIQSTDYVDRPPLDNAVILSNRVITHFEDKMYQFPIFSRVRKAKEDKYNIYFLHVPKYLLPPTPKGLPNEYEKAMKKEQLDDSNIKSLRGWKKYDCISFENKKGYYSPKEDDLYFESNSLLRGIGSGLAIIVRRISEKSDNIKYDIFDYHEVMIEQNNV